MDITERVMNNEKVSVGASLELEASWIVCFKKNQNGLEQVRMLATKPDDLNSILGTRVVERRKTPTGYLLASTCVLWCALTHIQINVI